MSDGTTNRVIRRDTRPVFDQNSSEVYPRTFDKHDNGTTVLKKLNENYSMLEGLPQISATDQQKKFLNIDQFSVEDTFNHVVGDSIAKMGETV